MKQTDEDDIRTDTEDHTTGSGPHGHHAGDGASHHPRRERRRRRGRAARGDVRLAVLWLLAEEPMHGYQLMQAIADRSDGRWTPSPGAIYPTINQLEDEGLVTVSSEAGRKRAALTDAGREHLKTQHEASSDPFADYGTDAPNDNLRELREQLHAATMQIARTGTDDQRAAAAEILTGTRRALYLLLADGSPNTQD